MKSRKNYLFGLLFVTAIISSCKKENPIVNPPLPDNEEELITTFKITFTDPDGVNPSVTAIFRDIDGPGGNNPTVFDTIRLKPNATYNAVIEFLNEAASPAEDITAEILEEAADHMICFDVTGANATIVRTDSDGTYEIGLASTWTTTAASSGTTVISLKHQPGIKNGSCDLGDTDIEISFVTEIE